MATSSHVWKFFRIGGLDQVAIETADDLLNLKHLDQKLWVALSCPVKGLELDEKTLGLIDADKDGRIRVPELLAAIDWAAEALRNPVDLLRGTDSLPLSSLNEGTALGKALLASAKELLGGLGQGAAAEITLDQALSTAKVYAATTLNGDGVIVPDTAKEPALKAVIADILATVGGTADRSGAAGVDQARIDTFYADLAGFAAWSEKASAPEVLGLGAGTAAASAAIKAVQTKVDDFFARTRLASFDARALAALNRSETEYLVLAAKDLSITANEVSGFPLARIEAGRALPLFDGVNPAWAGALAALHKDAVAPLYGSAKTSLNETEWTQLKAKVAAFDAHVSAKAGASVEKLGLDRVKALLAANQKAALSALVVQDLDLADEFAAVANVERLLRYVRDFRVILSNFVNFTDFYSPERWAVFQAGTLYLDSRSTEFCIRVDGPNALAAMSKAYIAYCDLKRPGGESMKIAACFTQGDSDYLFAGRNGIFYDRKGRDWDATITSIVDNPISIRQAFFSPYKKFLRMIEEQVAKRAAAADAEANAKLAAAADKTANADKAKPAEAPKKVDVGAVAAIGVAVTGAVSVVTLILGYIFGMKVWQYPLAFLGIILLISGPSMLIAWLKLRQRTLGPILEGNGWAINGRVKINIPFGTRLTQRATLPTGAQRSLDDPYEDKEAASRRTRIYIMLVLLAVAAIWVRYDHSQRGHYFWKKSKPAAAPVETPPAPVPAPAPAPAG
ncbi:MAG TPA: hypothetical protein PKX00_14740 [Opitutaceae bacterium]|nr:hypothetical protein [Opitutaceae bacterium]